MSTPFDTPTTALDPQLMAVKHRLPSAGGLPPIKTLVMTTQATLYQQLRNLLAPQNYQIDWQGEPRAHLAELLIATYELILVGPNLEPHNSILLSAELRRRTRVPIILLADDAYQIDQLVQAVELGADRVIRLPFEGETLTAHITALLRRSSWMHTRAQPQVLAVGAITLCHDTRTVKLNDQPLALSPLDYRLLHYLMQHAHRPVSKAELRRTLWPDRVKSGDYTIEVAIRRLRNKIEVDPATPQYLVTHYGAGYQLITP